MLDCEKLVTRPARSQARTSAPILHIAARAGPKHDGGDGDHHDHEEAPVDVRVEEQRVDPEVVVELIGGDHLRVQEERLSVVLDEADSREQQGLGDDHPETLEEQAALEAHAAQEQEQQTEGQIEEGEVLGGLPVIGRVARLERVEHDGDQQKAFKPARRSPEREPAQRDDGIDQAGVEPRPCRARRPRVGRRHESSHGSRARARPRRRRRTAG